VGALDWLLIIDDGRAPIRARVAWLTVSKPRFPGAHRYAHCSEYRRSAEHVAVDAGEAGAVGGKAQVSEVRAG